MEPTEQVPDTPPPKRRRRRRLILAFVLVLVSMVTWWYWPRGDARFVGKWKVHKENDAKSGDYVLDLRSGGVARLKWEDGRRIFTYWDVRDDRLILGGSPPGFIGRLVVTASQRLSSRTLGFRLDSESFYTIGELSADSIVSIGQSWSNGLVRRQFDARTIFTRIPE